MCLRSGCSLDKLRFGEKVQNQPVGRCQGFTEKGQTIIRKWSRKLHRCRLTSQFALKRLQTEAGFSTNIGDSDLDTDASRRGI